MEHLRNALETMRTEYEGRETAVRVCSCRFILEMVGYCKVPKVPAIAVLLKVLLLLGCQLCDFNSAPGGSFLFGGMCGWDRVGQWGGGCYFWNFTVVWQLMEATEAWQ